MSARGGNTHGLRLLVVLFLFILGSSAFALFTVLQLHRGSDLHDDSIRRYFYGQTKIRSRDARGIEKTAEMNLLDQAIVKERLAGDGRTSGESVAEDSHDFSAAAAQEPPCLDEDGVPCPEEEVKAGPPPGLMESRELSEADKKLFAYASSMSARQKPSTSAISVPRVAFLFLTRGPMPFSPLWERFFQGHEKYYSIYVHTSPSFTYATNDSHLFRMRQIRSEEVLWGDPTMVASERRLLANALLQPSNQRFILLSESCIPLFDFPFIYHYLIDSNVSFIHSMFSDAWGCGGRYSIRMAPTIRYEHWRKGSQWWSLTLPHARALVADTKLYPVMAKWCRGDRWHRHCFLDEHYAQTLLNVLGFSDISGRGLTMAQWEGFSHPVTYSQEQLTPGFLAQVKSNQCDWQGKQRPCFLFLRKISPGALQSLEALAAESFGY